MTAHDLLSANSMVWPLAFLLVALIVLRRLGDDVRPIFRNIVGSLSAQAGKNAVAWSIGIMIGTLGSLQALAEVASQMQWIYVAATAKVLQPGLAAVLGYIMKSPSSPQSSSNSNPATP